MFKGIYLGDDEYSEFIKKQNAKEREEEKEMEEKIRNIESSCDQIIRLLGRMQEDMHTMERKIDVGNETVKNKMVEICDIVEEINDNLADR